MNFNDIQNDIIQRLHQAGVNWGGTPTNAASNLVTPYWVQLEANLAYGRALTAVKDYPACLNPIEVNFPTMAGQQSWTMNPLPSLGPSLGTVSAGVGVSQANPAALQIYEARYTQVGAGNVNGMQIYLPFVSTERFRRLTGAYTGRLGAQSAWPDALCQRFGKRLVELYPATAVTGDTVTMTICPDPQVTGRVAPGVSCAQGGPMVFGADVPLLIDDFHKVIVEGAVESMARALNKPVIADQAKANWDALIDELTEYGSAQAEGDAEQKVQDTWLGTTMLDSEIF